MERVTIKCAAGYVGSMKIFKKLLAWNLLDLTPETRMKFRHVNWHRYMDGISRKKVIS